MNGAPKRLAMLAMVALGATRSAVAQATANPHDSAVGACATCHRPDAWRPARISPAFRHAPKTFPLDGAHATASCTSCHTSLVFSRAPIQCASCHEDVHKGELGVTCARCHTTRSFVDQARLLRLHEETLFPLRGMHVTTPCESCHAGTAAGQPQYAGRPTTCVGCHRPDYDRAATPPHASAGFPTACASCHGESSWQGAPFDHNTTLFPLTGAHMTATCTSCHGDGVYKGKATTCVSCHQSDYTKTAAPPHAASAFSTSCTSCHTTTSWQGAPFDHNTTLFPLTGAHVPVACATCHADGVYHGRPTTCISCHQADYAKTDSPPHAAAAFPVACTNCHTTTTWQGAFFDHNTTQFPLTGGHQAVACASCHGDNVYVGKSTACVSCHQADFNTTTDPPHAAAGLATTCASCHTTVTWAGATFDHNTTTFPLTGGHLAVTCAGCHSDGVYKGKPTTCVSCHQTDFSTTNSPPHVAAGFATTCAGCHTTSTWLGAAFDHGTTAFPLTGAHITVPCSSCHADGVFKGKPTTCISCHQADYNNTTAPAHAAAGYATDCTLCHGTAAWQGASFDHNTTQFPLTGAHIPVPCASCHGDGVFKGKPTTCVSCHQADFNGTNSPPHAAAGFATTCAECHTTTSWAGAVFDHNTTPFPLTGAHLSASCAACHGDGVYKGKSTACVSCHQADYNGTTNPVHAAAGYSTDCITCHTSTTTWQGAVFDHNTTQFPLTGAHLAVACNSCHGDGVFKGKSTACVSCHQPDYNGTNAPPHAVAGFATTCTTCHNTTTWLTATWDHSGTGWPLTGIHTATPCASCHGDGVYHGKSTLCASCHTPEYNSTTNPIHAAAHFPTTCESCHTTSTWLGATFNHDAAYFPIYSGSHNNRWTACSDCHTSPTDFSVYTCTTTCHPQASTDSHHKGNARYQYLSSACYSCHPRGNGG